MRKEIRYIFTLIAGLMLLGACSEDKAPAPEKPAADDGKVKVSMTVPAEAFGTRAEEPDFNNIYLVAIPCYVAANNEIYGDNVNSQEDFNDHYSVTITPLNAPRNVVVNGQAYQQYDISLYPGYYLFYVVANLDRYLSDSTGKKAMTEMDIRTAEDMENLIFFYQTDEPLSPLHLPMACLPDNVGVTYTLTDEDEAEEGGYSSTVYRQRIAAADKDVPLVQIVHGLETTLTAEMKFLCSKVRVTILFNSDETDPAAFSTDFGEEKIAFYSGDTGTPYAINLRKQTKIRLGASLDFAGFIGQDKNSAGDITGNPSIWTLDLRRYNYPSNGINYPTRPTDELSLFEGTEEEWYGQKKRAWQCVAYLPENDRKDEGIEHTFLRFPYQIRTADNRLRPGDTDYKEIELFANADVYQHYPDYYEPGNNNGVYDDPRGTNNHGLERGMMYDVVALVKTKDSAEGFEITVKVRVLPWAYNDVDASW